VGAALAHREDDTLVIDVQSDGDALYTPGALWTAARHRLPLLIVMDNNRAYKNSAEHAARIAWIRSRPPRNARVGTALDDPPVDFAGLARSLGVHGEGPVSTPEELRAALTRALNLVRNQQRPALLDVVTSAEG
jgi:thiamine pyrophosphate-dependent acetolactate synthase large subunit-like protein